MEINPFKITITREKFFSLSDFSLGRELIQPVIDQVMGKNIQKKKEIYARLTPGQKTLFGFWVLYGHIQSGWFDYLFYGEYGPYLPMIKTGLHPINDTKLLENIAEAENLYLHYQDCLNDKGNENKIREMFAPIDNALFNILPATMGMIERSIRTNPDEFVNFVN